MKQRDARSQPGSPPAVTAATTPPLKPRPVLFAVLAIVMALWILGLLVMYFRTVRPVYPPSGVPTTPAALPERGSPASVPQ